MKKTNVTNEKNLFYLVPEFHPEIRNSRAARTCFVRRTYKDTSNINTYRPWRYFKKNNSLKRRSKNNKTAEKRSIKIILK